MRIERTALWHDDVIELFVLEAAHVTQTYLSWLSDPVVNRFLESRFASHDHESVRCFVQSALSDQGTLLLGIRSLELERHVGNVKIGPIDRTHGTADIGIMIGDREAWGRGIATRAIVRASEIARAELHIRKLCAGCYASNVGSARAFEKAGFHLEGRRVAHCLLEGAPEDVVLLGRVL